MSPFDNQGGQGLPWSLPPELQAPPKVPDSSPGDGLKKFINSGAVEAFRNPDPAPKGVTGPNLDAYLNMYQG